ncbi:MAG TPA: cation:proton antiporter [Vicinamibacterales bacterium]|jgi:CPA2 family monovalent cation:H+ antiporter-2|nr:cation:proton antiporter [Vicinamibacterales bacterium]
MELIADLTLVVIAAVVGGFAAQRLRQPPLVGYLLAGVAIGPFTGGLTVDNPHELERLAEIGVALLLFSLGLEVSFRDLVPVRRVAIAGTLIQIVVTALVGFGVAAGLGWPREPAMWFGAAVSLSSTMVVLKTLQAQGRLGTLSSRVMLGILVAQDLAVVPMMILLPELGGGSINPVAILLASGRAALLIAAIVFVATRLVPPVLGIVARGNSRELFLLTTTAVALGVGFAAWRFGLSMALGAFIAGLVVNESAYAHQALSDVIPLRDLFGMLFFVSAGMLLDPGVVWEQLGAIGISVAAVAAAKALIVGGVVRAFGYRRIVPVATALTLFQAGEFGFVLAGTGRTIGALNDSQYTVLVNTAIATMALTPVVSGAAPWLYRRLRRRHAAEAPLTINLPALLSDHLVIAGAGRVGRTVAGGLASVDVPFVVIEFDARRFEHAREAGFPAIFGDAGQMTILRAAAVERARAIIVTVPSFDDVRNIVSAARMVRPDIAIAARAPDPEGMASLREFGIDDVTSPEIEGAIEMTRLALLRSGAPTERVMQAAEYIRRRPYQSRKEE